MDEPLNASVLERVVQTYEQKDQGRHEFLELEDLGVIHVRIDNPKGLHVRPSTQVCATASKYSGLVYVVKKGSSEFIDAKSILSLMMLAADFGNELYFVYDLSDPEKARENAAEIRVLFEGNFGILGV